MAEKKSLVDKIIKIDEKEAKNTASAFIANKTFSPEKMQFLMDELGLLTSKKSALSDLDSRTKRELEEAKKALLEAEETFKRKQEEHNAAHGGFRKVLYEYDKCKQKILETVQQSPNNGI